MPEDATPKTSSQSSSRKRRSKKSRGDLKQEQIIRLKSLSVRNFKSLDNFSMEFKPPRMERDLDILVIGSSNGVGKTSILEACALLLFGLIMGKGILNMPDDNTDLDILDLIITAGEDEANISGIFETKDNERIVRLTLHRSGKIIIESEIVFPSDIYHNAWPLIITQGLHFISWHLILKAIMGTTTEPLLFPPLFLYFHSYRKIQEGHMEMGRLIQDRHSHRVKSVAEALRERSGSNSVFKLEILRALMSRENLFEDFDPVQAREVIDTLNQLLTKFAKVSIGKLRLSRDNTIDFRVIPKDKADHTSFSFDSLSSGQKEIISTLFLIWRYTKGSPGIILIDEPELHLNAEWHKRFIHHLEDHAPYNQYIIATHSEDIFAAVDEDRRMILVSDKE